MANIKSQVKRNKTNEKARLRNSSYKSSMRTAIKKVEVACKAKNKDEALVLIPNAFSKIDSAVTKGVLHKNAAARKKSHLSNLVNSL